MCEECNEYKDGKCTWVLKDGTIGCWMIAGEREYQ